MCLIISNRATYKQQNQIDYHPPDRIVFAIISIYTFTWMRRLTIIKQLNTKLKHIFKVAILPFPISMWKQATKKCVQSSNLEPGTLKSLHEMNEFREHNGPCISFVYKQLCNAYKLYVEKYYLVSFFGVRLCLYLLTWYVYFYTTLGY